MASKKLTITIESAKSGRKHVSLGDFSFQLDALRRVLSTTESFVSGKGAVIDWQVVDLRHSSPAEVVLQPVHTRTKFTDESKEDIIFKTVNEVIGYLKTLSGEASPPFEMNRQLLGHYKTFSDRIQKGILKVSVRSETDTIKISKNIKSAIDAVILPETKSIGVVEGRLEYVNIHGNRNLFRIYSVMEPERMDCFFPPDKIEEAREALDRKIRVSGELTYPEGSDFPKAVKVETIELLPEDDELPSLMDLRGIAPDLTGSLSSEEFVRNLRDAE